MFFFRGMLVYIVSHLQDIRLAKMANLAWNLLSFISTASKLACQLPKLLNLTTHSILAGWRYSKLCSEGGLAIFQLGLAKKKT